MVSKRDFDNVTYDWSCNIYEDRKALSVHIYYTWRDLIRMTSHLCNKYEQIMLSYLPSVNYLIQNGTIF